MDYLPLPSEYSGQHLEVPFVATFEYDQLDLESPFDDFLSRRDLDWNTLLGEDREQDLINSVIQSWLYFGLVARFLREPIQFRDYRRLSDDGKEIVTAEALAKRLTDKDLDFIVPGFGLSPVKSSGAWNHPWNQFSQDLQTAENAVERLETSVASQESNRNIPVLALSVRILQQVLHIVSMPLTDRRLLRGIKPLENTKGQIPICAKALLAHMDVLNICPFQAQNLCTTQWYVSAYIASFIAASNLSGRNHSSCMASRCMAYDVDESTYQIAHVESTCRCDELEVPMNELKDIIERDKVPLLSLQDSPTGVCITVTEATLASNYIAISHVWADGLGNPHTNSLPRCQLARLQTLVNSSPMPTFSTSAFHNYPSLRYTSSLNPARRLLFGTKHEPSLFWIDTLCVPVQSQYRHLRKKSMIRLGAVYAGARHVLVLDRALMRLDLKPDLRVRLLVHALTSGWCSRCWTFEESSLSTYCRFQIREAWIEPLATWIPRVNIGAGQRTYQEFAKDFVLQLLHSARDWHHLWAFGEQEGHRLNRHQVLGSRLRWMNPLKHRTSLAFLHYYVERQLASHLQKELQGSKEDLKFEQAPDSESFKVLWRTLALRSTSKIEDKIHILATLLNFNISPLLDITLTQLNIYTILRSLDTIPCGLIFDTVPRVDPGKVHRLRWMPSEPSVQELESDSGNITSDSSGFHLEHDSHLLCVDLSSLTTNHSEFSLTVEFEEGRLVYFDALLQRDVPDELIINDWSNSLLLLDPASAMDCSTKGALFHQEKKWVEVRKHKPKRSRNTSRYVNFFRFRTPSQTTASDLPTSHSTTEDEDEASDHFTRVRFKALYDCPILLRRTTVPSMNLPSINARLTRGYWKLTMVADEDLPVERLRRRPPRLDYLFWLLTLIWLSFLMNCVVFYIAGTLMIISVQDPPLTPVTKHEKRIKVALICCNFLIDPVANRLTQVIPVVGLSLAGYYASCRGSLSKLEKAAIVLLGSGFVIHWIIRAVWLLFLAPYVYKMWLDSFNEGWNDGRLNSWYRWLRWLETTGWGRVLGNRLDNHFWYLIRNPWDMKRVILGKHFDIEAETELVEIREC